MSETNWAGFMGEFRAQETDSERASRMARQGADQADRQAERDEAERAAARADERDQRLFRYAQLGLTGRSMAEVVADASSGMDEDAQFEAARAVVEKIGRRREIRARAMRYQAEQLEAVSRAAVPADPFEAAQRRAHQAFAEHTRAMLSEAATGAPRRVTRPKEVSRSHGAVIRRSECCTYCIEQGATDQESFLLHSDPSFSLPVTSPQQLEQLEQAERRGQGGRTPMIYR